MELLCECRVILHCCNQPTNQPNTDKQEKALELPHNIIELPHWYQLSTKDQTPLQVKHSTVHEDAEKAVS